MKLERQQAMQLAADYDCEVGFQLQLFVEIVAGVRKEVSGQVVDFQAARGIRDQDIRDMHQLRAGQNF